MIGKEEQVKNSIIYLIPVAVSHLFPFITLPLFTRILSTADFGALALALIYAVFAGGIADVGLTVGFNRDFFQFSETVDRHRLLYSVIVFVLIAETLVGTATFFFRESLAELIVGSNEHGDLLFLAFCSNASLILLTYFKSFYKNSEKAKSYSAAFISSHSIAFLLSILFIVVLRTGVIGLVLAPLIGNVIVFLALIIVFVRKVPLSFNISGLKSVLKLSYPLTPKALVGVIATNIDKYMLGLLKSVGGVGVYSIGQKFSNLLFVYMTTLQNVFSPQVYQRMFNMEGEGKAAIGQYLTPFAYASIAAGLAVSCFAEEAITILTPESFHGAIEITIILTMYYGLMFFGKQPQLVYAKKTHISMLLNVFGMVLTAGINIPFILKFGVIGAAWGTFIAGFVLYLVSFFVAQHYYRIEWEYIKIGLIYMIFIVTSLVLVGLKVNHSPYYLRLIVKALAIAGYGYLGIRIGFISRENLGMLTNLIKPAPVEIKQQ